MELEYEQGNHICALYESDEEQLSIAASFVAEGLSKDERCLFVARSEEFLESFRTALSNLGTDAARMEERGALMLATNAEAHLADGCFDSERMLRLLNDALEAALNAGFQGLRTCGDMSWLLGEPEGAEQVVEYEALLNQFFSGVRGLGMCLFDRSRLPAHLIDHALATHSSVTLEGRHLSNPFYELPAVAAVRSATPEKVFPKINALRRGFITP